MKVYQNFDLTSFNTFGFKVQCNNIFFIDNELELIEASRIIDSNSIFVLGGGSNLLLTKNIKEPILKIDIKGKKIIKETDEYIDIEVGAGEIWHEFVTFCVNNNWGGVENLALIPGTVGASPIQNIGAYGIEVKDVIRNVRFYQWNTGELMTLEAKDCAFDYRDSYFKSIINEPFVITAVTFRLNKQPTINTEYGVINNEILKVKSDKTEWNIHDVYNAVINIRTNKLPDPAKIGNSGSFFKNPIISQVHFEKLQITYDNMPFYKVEHGYKIPAAWLIEQTGWKGKTINNYGVHPVQPLVLVNYGGASGDDILKLSDDIIRIVHDTFGIELEREVRLYK